MDPRVLKATSVKADPTAPATAEPQALKITAASSNPKMFTLPWEKPLATWPDELLANLPRGISRHVVRFVHVGDSVYAMKEITRNVAEREYELLRRLEKLELPTVEPIAVVTGRHTREGEPLEAILVTRHLKFLAAVPCPVRPQPASGHGRTSDRRLGRADGASASRRFLLGRCLAVERPVPAATPTRSPRSWWMPRPAICMSACLKASANTISTWLARISSAN